MLFFDGYIYVLLLVLHDKWNFHFCTYQSITYTYQKEQIMGVYLELGRSYLC